MEKKFYYKIEIYKKTQGWESIAERLQSYEEAFAYQKRYQTQGFHSARIVSYHE